ncbi:MAG TPA: putative glycoside hydrolase [Bacillales bacterium]|nr:putative glycoside hydrolase [Bacillales bacterium]
MGRKWVLSFVASLLLFIVFKADTSSAKENVKLVQWLSTAHFQLHPLVLPDPIPRFVFDSGYDFQRPKHVRGIYSTAWSAGGSRLDKLINYIDSNDLNAIVIDIKDDHGTVTFTPEDKNAPYAFASKSIIGDPEALMKKLEQHHIWPIARIVCFKDAVYAEKHPEATFKKPNGEIWTNGNGEAFINPFLKQTWDYNVSVAKAAVKLGFQEIQFDYVRFPEGFERRAGKLTYTTGTYPAYNEENKKLDVKQRVNAVTDFVAYAHEQLDRFDVDVSVDIFGYTATLPAAPGIGQNMSRISQHVDVISAMIYPSHWTSYFGIRYPDLHPYELTDAYAKAETEKLSKLENPPISRPWIQDFTATWLPHHLNYGKAEVEAQVKALEDNGIHEFLVWDAANTYTPGVDYTPGN